MEKCSASLIIKEMHLTLIRMAIIKKHVGENVDKLEPVWAIDGNAK